jgi:hypothetical protein
MPLGCIRVDPEAFPPLATMCLRCGAETVARFAGLCDGCTAALRTAYSGEGRAIEAAAYEPAMHVTPNAVALKDD